MIFSAHALGKMKARGVTVDEVMATVCSPRRVDTSRLPGQHRTHDRYYRPDMELCVTAQSEGNELHIVTVLWFFPGVGLAAGSISDRWDDEEMREDRIRLAPTELATAMSLVPATVKPARPNN